MEIEIDKEILPMSKVLSNEGTHGTENRGPVRENLKKKKKKNIWKIRFKYS